MKTSKKLVFEFYFVILLILFIGLVSLYSMIRFNENGQVKEEINEFVRELELSIVDFLLLINTDNLADYEEIKADIKFERKRIDSLHIKIDPALQKFNLHEDFDHNLDEFTAVSNTLIKIQRETIIDNNEFDKKYLFERDIRRERRLVTAELNSINLISIGWRLEYHSKEALFQFKDQAHIDSWFESINLFRDTVVEINLQEEKKEALLENIDSYQPVASDLAQIILRQSKSKEDKQLKIKELREIVDKIEEDVREISKETRSQSNSLARTTFLIIIGITVIGIVLLFVFQRYFIGKLKRKSI